MSDISSEAKGAARALWPPHFAAAIFDFDGTIAFTHELWNEVDRAFLGARGIQVSPEYQRRLSVLGFEAGAQYTIETYHLDERVADICEEWNRMGRALYESRVRLRPGVKPYIDALKARGVRCALATVNDPEVLRASRHINVNELFDVCVYGREVGRPKDYPDIYLEAARRLKVAPANCIVFEDLLAGLRSAHRARMLTCAVASDDPNQVIGALRSVSDMFLSQWNDIDLSATNLGD